MTGQRPFVVAGFTAFFMTISNTSWKQFCSVLHFLRPETDYNVDNSFSFRRALLDFLVLWFFFCRHWCGIVALRTVSLLPKYVLQLTALKTSRSGRKFAKNGAMVKRSYYEIISWISYFPSLQRQWAKRITRESNMGEDIYSEYFPLVRF